jgi:acetyl-CoA C-acetyltransferase
MTEAYLFDAIRTPRGRGKHAGALHEVKPIDLLARSLAVLRERNSLETAAVDDLIIGCVTPVGDQGFNIAKSALLHAGWSQAVSGFQLNRFCSSGLEAVITAAGKVRAGWEELVVAGGVECMSRIPIGSDGGPLLFDPEVLMGVHFVPQGIAADLIATIEGFGREAVDAYALQSQERTLRAQKEGYFNEALIPIYDRNGLLILAEDEQPRPDTNLEKLADLPPAFAALGATGFDEMALHKYPLVERIQHVHTAGNSSGIADGAALLLVGSKEKGEALGLRPRARIVAAANVSVEPTIMLTGPAPAAEKALRVAGMGKKDIDLWECNEAFASVVLKFQKDLDLDPEIVNVNGGAIALGHPLGATGAMLLGTLLDELERRDLQTGLVTMCVGGGMGTAVIIQRS